MRTIQQITLQQSFRFTVSRFSDGKDFYIDRKPRRGSKWWDDSKYLVWNNRDNCKEFKN